MKNREGTANFLLVPPEKGQKQSLSASLSVYNYSDLRAVLNYFWRIAIAIKGFWRFVLLYHQQ